MLVGATLIAVASIVGLNIAQVAHADTCVTVAPKSGNPHCPDPEQIAAGTQKTNPQGKIVGNPHDFDDGLTSGNPHIPER